MEQAKHTPGPWIIEKWKKFNGEEITQVSAFSEDGNRIMQAVVNSANNDDYARLIAAAPELLSVLKMVQEAAIDMRGEDFNLTTEQWAVFRAAIAKATGANQ